MAQGVEAFVAETKFRNFRDNYIALSSLASGNARTLAFAGLAFVWLFKPSAGGVNELPGLLYASGCLFVLTLILDVLQYAYATAAWGIYCRLKEKEGERTGNPINDDTDVSAPEQINWPTLALFWAKQATLFVAYFIVALYMFISKFYPDGVN